MGTRICTYNYSVMSMFIFIKVTHDCPSADYGSHLVILRSNGSIIPRTLRLCFRLKGVVNVILRSLYPLRKIPCVQWIGSHVVSRASTNIVMKSEVTFPAGNRFPNIHSAIALPNRNPYSATSTVWNLMPSCGIINTHGAFSRLKLCARAHYVISVGINFFLAWVHIWWDK